LKRPKTVAGRVLAIWAAATGLWYFALFMQVLGSTWSGRAIGVALATGLTLGMVLLAWHAFRRRIVRPLRTGGVNGWLARQPGWRAAVIMTTLYLAPVTCVLLIVASRARQPLPPMSWLGFSGQVLVAAAIGTFWALVIQRQRERALADVAPGPHERTGLGE